MIWILIAIALIGLVYLVGIKPYKYWTKKHVKQGNPWPIVGDNWGTVLRKHSFSEMIQNAYNIAPKSRYCGIYQFLLPTLVLKDTDLIKDIAVKEFDHFLDHRSFIPEDADPLWGKNLFSLKGQKWRDMRSTLSPAFTGSKMKLMFGLITDISEQFVQHFLKKNENIVTIEMKDTFTRFTNDVIASAAFGIKCDSLEEKNNEFYMMGKDATDFSNFWKNMKFFGYFLVPKLFAFFKVTLFSKPVSEFFTNVVKTNIKDREAHGIVRPDMINLLMEARTKGLKYEENAAQNDTGFATVEESEIGKSSTGTKQALTDVDITAQALIFFFAGFDTVSSMMCFMAYELGANQNIQHHLRKEVDEVYEQCNGKLTYEALSSMKYMDMVTSETLRKWPAAVAVDRVCTKPYTIRAKTPDEVDLVINVGDLIWIPIFAIHRDPEYFPNPDQFDPERFSDRNKSKIVPYSFLPFGAGPRNCIGSRFALLETKALIFYILTSFEIVPVEKTEIPLKISKKQFNLTSEGGFWFGLKKREKKVNP